jgi:hypothetical protein
MSPSFTKYDLFNQQVNHSHRAGPSYFVPKGLEQKCLAYKTSHPFLASIPDGSKRPVLLSKSMGFDW